MRILKTSAKLALGVLGICSVVALAESLHDKTFYSASFMDDVQPIELNIVEPEIKTRLVASSINAPKSPVTQTVNMNLKKIVDGPWEIIKMENTIKGVSFSKENPVEGQDEAELIVPVELVGKSLVRLDNDDELVYRTSLLTRFGTMRVFKEFEDGSFEVIELIKVKNEEEAELAEVEEEREEQEEAPEKKSKFDIEEDLYLVSALDPKRSRRVSSLDGVEGSASLVSGELTVEGIVLHKDTKFETEPLSFTARLNDYGAFNNEGEVAGVVTVIGNKEIKIVFSVGPLASAALNLVIEEKKSEIEDRMRASQEMAEQNRLDKEAQEPQQVQASPVEQVSGQRAQQRQFEEVPQGFEEEERFEDELLEEELPEEELLDEEMAAQVKKEGFNFGPAPSRDIASQK